MKAIVTGAKGFIGAHLARRLLTDGWKVVGIPGTDPGIPNSLKALGVKGVKMRSRSVTGPLATVFIREEPDIVVHLAAESIVSTAESNPRRVYETNVMGTVNVLEACREFDVPCLISSSDKAYGESPPPFREDTPLRPVWPYDVSKACQDLVAMSYARLGVPVSATRSVNVFGPGDLNWTRLFPHTIRAALSGRSPHNYKESWLVRREWIYIDDTVEMHRRLIGRMVAGECLGVAFNIGATSGHMGTVKSPSEIVPEILELAGSTKGPILVGRNFHELGDEYVDASRAQAVLGDHPPLAWPVAVRRTVDWYREFLTTEA